MTPEEEQLEWQRILSELKERDARMLIALAIDSQVNARERGAAASFSANGENDPSSQTSSMWPPIPVNWLA